MTEEHMERVRRLGRERIDFSLRTPEHPPERHMMDSLPARRIKVGFLAHAVRMYHSYR